MPIRDFFDSFYKRLLSDSTKKKSEKIILSIAIASFIIHLGIIFLVDFGLIFKGSSSPLLKNPISAIYTPFSFILVYEVYLLVYYLPKSISIYVTKQYEIITLIIIRRLFKDLANLELSTDWFKIKYDLQFTYDLLASLILFFLIFQFYTQSKKRYASQEIDEISGKKIANFIKLKKTLATLLVPILFFVAIYTFTDWTYSSLMDRGDSNILFENINNIFFEQFFTILIIADVILLLFSFFYTDKFHKVIRNSGFIISTILIRVSFSVSGLLNVLLILSAISFGLLILLIHNQFEKQLAKETEGQKEMKL